ncbi:MAG TPA: DUF4340 domain-containing protein [bacterium]|nr:DUF4340 domain-containing protein [bacterium]
MRSMRWLVAALVILAAIYGGLHLGSMRKAGPRPLFPDFKADAAQKISLASPQGRVVLEKKDDVWVVSSEASYPADAANIQKILDAVSGFSRNDMISSNPEKQAAYQVDSTGIAVTIEDAAGKPRAAFIVGKLGPDYQSTYVRDANSARVILAPGYLRSVFSRGKQSWQDKRVFKVDLADIVTITIKKPGLSMALERASDGKWHLTQPEGAECDSNKATRVARALAFLTADDFAGHMPMPEAGVDKPDSSVSFRVTSGAEATLFIGHAAANGSFYVARDKSDVIYFLNPQSVRNLLPDLASLAPTPETAKPNPAAPPAAPTAAKPGQH